MADFVFGVPGDDDKALDAGRIFVTLAAHAAGSTTVLGSDVAGRIVIDGVAAGDLAGATVGSISDLNGDGRAEILIGAAGMDKGAVLDAGAVFVLWGQAVAAGIDLADPFSGAGNGKGYAIKGQNAGDGAGGVVLSVGDMNGDGIADVLVGAAGNDAGGLNAGAVYVVWGGRTGPVDLALIAQGIGGAKIVGAAGSLTGAVVSIGVADLIIGAPGAGGAAHVLFTPLTWQPDHNVYGTSGADIMDVGFGGVNGIGAGNDSILGLAGNDSINGAGGADTIEGGAGNDTLIGGSGSDTLDGGTGADSMSGGDGFDIYIVDNSGDVVTETALFDSGDTVRTSVSYILSDLVEKLTLTAAGLTGTVNALSNYMVGTAGSDTLNGGTNADWMVGGAGNDTYFVDIAADLADEAAAGGTDTVISAVDLTLGLNLENLTLTEAARNGTGNELANRITATAFDDTLNGGLGADTLTGLAGDDTYIVDNAADVVTEAAGAGTDSVTASANYTLSANVENLTLTGAGR